MHNLKEKLQVLELSDIQKKRMKENIQRPANRKNNTIPFVFAAAVALAIFFVALSLSPSSPTTTVQGANSKETLPFMTLRVVLWSIANTVLAISFVFLLKKCLRIVERWQYVHSLQQLNGKLYKMKNAIGVVLLLVAFIWGGAIILPWPLLFAQGCFIVLLIAVFVLGQVNQTKDKHWTVCPHCQVKMKRRHIISKAALYSYETCASCEGRIFIHEKSPFLFMFLFIAYVGFPLNSLFGLSKIFVVIYIILSFTAVCVFTVPYIITFYKTEK